jgi:hypothetical protein
MWEQLNDTIRRPRGRRLQCPRFGYGVYAIGLTNTREQLPAERD